MAVNRALKVGERVKVVSAQSGHNFAVGTLGKVVYLCNPGNNSAHACYQLLDDKGNRSTNVYQMDLELCPTSRADILKEAESLRAQIKALDSQIAYLDETRSETFDDLEWRCYQALKAIKDSTDTVETSKVVAKLVRDGA